MLLQLHLIRRVLEFLRLRKTEIPLQPQPIDYIEGLRGDAFDIGQVWSGYRRERFGPMPAYRRIVELKGTPPFGIEQTYEFLGNVVSGVTVPPDRALHFEALVQHPSGARYELTGTLPTGTNWSFGHERRYLASALKRQNARIDRPSSFILESTVTVNWYLRGYRKIPLADVV